MKMRQRSLRFAVGLAILTATVAFAPPAAAQTSLEQAKALTGRASIEYNIGHFEQALELYSLAYQALPTPALLFDIGQCHRMLGNAERAMFFFQGYLRDKPDAPNRVLVEQILADLQRQVDAQRAAHAQESAPAVTPAPGAATPADAVAPPPPPTAEVAAPPVIGNPPLRVAGLASAGAGVVLMGTAAALGLHASSLSGEISQLSSSRGTWSPQYQSDYDSGKSAATAATVLYVVGGLALATGGVLTYLGWPRRASDARPVAVVAPAPGGASVGVVGRF
jgi:tetratricopeptide (TPR) repeat protein